MITVNDVLDKVSEANMKLFYTSTTSDFIEEKLIAIGEESIEELIDFAITNNIKSIQYMLSYISQEIFQISEEMLDEAQIPDELSDEIWNVLSEYNNQLEEINYDRPISITIYCLYEGNFFGITDYDFWFKDEGIEFPSVKLNEITELYKTQISEQRSIEKEKREKLRDEFKTLVLNDQEFLTCTNSNLRKAYVRKIFENTEFEKFRIIFDRNGSGLYLYEANLYIENIWRESKRKLK